MNLKTLKSVLAALGVLLSLNAMAEKVEIDGIYYNLIDKAKQAEVTSGSNKYTGEVTIPDSIVYQGATYSVTSIGESAFSGCYGLTSVTIPNSVTSIGYEAFYGCSGLTAVHISDLAAWCGISFSSSSNNPLRYAHHLYLNGEEVKDLVIPSSVSTIGEYAFYNCTSLTSVTIPNSVTSIGRSAFSYCSGLTSVTIPNSVTSIGNYAFSSCSELTSIAIPNSVTSIGNGAFRGCSGLTTITIPNSVTSIGSEAFWNCSSLTTITIPNSVTSIGQYAFYGCSGLTAVTIPNSVTSIGGYAFQLCSGLTSITIPNSVTSIGNYAFNGCSGLTSVKVEWNRPLANAASFDSTVKQSATLYVPKGTAMMYMAATGWSEFVNIQEYEDEEDAHYITIRMGDGGVLKQSVEVGKIYTYAIKADEEWEVSTLTFDGKDMTTQLLDGQFSTPVITGSAELNVVFKQESTGVKERVADTGVKVYVIGKSINVAGAEEDAPVDIYKTNGMKVASATGNARVPLESGIYIVKVGRETFKVAL